MKNQRLGVRTQKSGARGQAVDWVISHSGNKGADSYALECLRCGRKLRVYTPIEIDLYVSMMKAFLKIHRKCKKPVNVPANQAGKGD